MIRGLLFHSFSEMRLRQGNTAMHRACAYGQAAACKILLKYGARATYINNAGFTPMDIARKSGNFGCAEIIEDSLRIRGPQQQVKRPSSLSLLCPIVPCTNAYSLFTLFALLFSSW